MCVHVRYIVYVRVCVCMRVHVRYIVYVYAGVCKCMPV